MSYDETSQLRKHLLDRFTAGEIDKPTFDQLSAEFDALESSDARQPSKSEDDDLWEAVVSEEPLVVATTDDSSDPAKVHDLQPRFPIEVESPQHPNYDPDWDHVIRGTRYVQVFIVCGLSNAMLKLINLVTKLVFFSNILIPALALIGMVLLLAGQVLWIRQRVVSTSAFGALTCAIGATIAIVVVVALQRGGDMQTPVLRLLSLAAVSAAIPWMFFVSSVVRQVAEHFEYNRLNRGARHWLVFTYVSMALTCVVLVLPMSDVNFALPVAVLVVLQSGLHFFSTIWLFSLLNSVCRLIWRSKMRVRVG